MLPITSDKSLSPSRSDIHRHTPARLLRLAQNLAACCASRLLGWLKLKVEFGRATCYSRFYARFHGRLIFDNSNSAVSYTLSAAGCQAGCRAVVGCFPRPLVRARARNIDVNHPLFARCPMRFVRLVKQFGGPRPRKNRGFCTPLWGPPWSEQNVTVCHT